MDFGSGGSVPIEDGILIALNRLNRVLHYDAARRVAVVEPGIINVKVSDRAAPDGLYYAPDPSSGPICTIGGNVAFNSGGAHCLKYGMTANHVLGLKVVMPDGEVCQLGGDSLEMVKHTEVTGSDVELAAFYQQRMESMQRFFNSLDNIVATLLALDNLRLGSLSKLLGARNGNNGPSK